MKKLIPLLALLLILAGCSRQAAPVPDPVPETPPAAEIVEIPEPAPAEPEPTPDPVPEPVPEPEPPVIETPALPDLPQPVYCWRDTAVSKDGTVILQVPDHTLELCYDVATGTPVGILSAPNNLSWFDLKDGFYSLDGQPMITDTGMPYVKCFGDLLWYGNPGDYTLLRLSDGTVLQDGLRTAQPAGDYLAIQSNFWNDPCMLMDKTGQVVLELERGFKLTDVCKDQGSYYLLMSNTTDGTMNLVNMKGEALLDRFYDEITGISQGCAIVRDGSTYLAVSLTTEKTVFSWDHAFTLLPDAAIADTTQGSILVDRQGSRLDDRLFSRDSLLYDWNGDGNPEYILITTLHDVYLTLVLAGNGAELAAIPMHTVSVRALSPTALAYATPTGTDALCFEAHLVDLRTGTDTVLTAGTNLHVEPITTSGGQMLLCTSDEGTQLFLNDGTPARDDLGVCTYIGGDVFSCEEGLRCLDGSWLYKPE